MTARTVEWPRAGACLAAGVLCLFGFAAGAGAADPDNPDWPCIQRKVPEISVAVVWAGPDVDEADRRWRDGGDLESLVRTLVARRVPLEDATARIDSYAADLGPDKDATLTLLFTGLWQTINAERSEIMNGIERYDRRQKALAATIKQHFSERDGLLGQDSSDATAQQKLHDLEERLAWETRIFDEREKSLKFVCESPVLLEQRLFALARQIMGHLDE